MKTPCTDYTKINKFYICAFIYIPYSILFQMTEEMLHSLRDWSFQHQQHQFVSLENQYIAPVIQ